MPAPYFWSNVTIELESALGAAKAITSITKANPGVASFAADPALADGDYFYVQADGMGQVDGRVFRSNGPAGSGPYTVQLEGENTTLYSTFTSGNAYEITFGTTVNKTTDIQVSGGEPNYEEWAYIQDSQQRRQPVSTSPLSLSMECVWDPEDTALAQVLADTKAYTSRAIKVSFAGGLPIMVFRGSVSGMLLPTGQARGLVRTRLVIDGQGAPTYYTAAAS
jgi:hypothetical protein